MNRRQEEAERNKADCKESRLQVLLSTGQVVILLVGWLFFEKNVLLDGNSENSNSH